MMHHLKLKPSERRIMSKEEMKIRLQERHRLLASRMNHMDRAKDPHAYNYAQTELNIITRRIQHLDSLPEQGRGE